MQGGNGKDVAALAGVSTKTVSRVINGDRAVAPATRQRVEAAIAQLGYRQNHAASSLRRGCTRTIRLIILLRGQRLEQEYFQGALIDAVIDHAAAAGYSVLLELTREGDSPTQLARLADTRSEGAIVLDGRRQSPVVAALVASQQPIVVLVNSSQEGAVATIDADFLGGARAAVAYLIGLGHVRIAYLGDDLCLHSSRARRSGYHKALRAAGIPIDDQLITTAGYLQAHGAEAVTRLLEGGQSFTALFCVNDLTALGAIEALCRRGMRVPEDVSVVGFDDIPLAGLFTPPLTTLHIPWYEMAAAATEQLISALETGTPLQSAAFPVELRCRATTAPVRTPDPPHAGRDPIPQVDVKGGFRPPTHQR